MSWNPISDTDSVQQGARIRFVLSQTYVPFGGPSRDKVYQALLYVPGFQVSSVEEGWLTVVIPGKTNWNVEGGATIQQPSGDLKQSVVSQLNSAFSIMGINLIQNGIFDNIEVYAQDSIFKGLGGDIKWSLIAIAVLAVVGLIFFVIIT